MRRRPPGARAAAPDAPSLFEADAEAETPAVYADVGETFPGASPASALAVSTVTQIVKDVVEGAFIPLWLRGEVSDFKSHRNGHWYFCLRDASSSIKCVVWARDQRNMPAAPDDGMQVTALGQLGVYAARGEMQLSIRRMEADGEGLRRKAFDAARGRLERDGLLDLARKRELPRYPRRIAAVTSTSGAALHDIAAVLRRRAPGVQLIVVHAAVQGEGAPLELCRALDRVRRWGGADLVIIGRGGGSREDLWAFNDERVARAVAACPVPTISAVGHEVDVTLCDLVADRRAATPSAAAETAVASRTEVSLELGAQRARLLGAMRACLDEPRQRGAAAGRALSAAASGRVAGGRTALSALAGRLNALSPLATLERGYAVASDADGGTLASVRDFAPGGAFSLRVHDGVVDATTVAVRPLQGPGTSAGAARRSEPAA